VSSAGANDWQALTKLTGGSRFQIERVRLVDEDIAIEGRFDLPPLASLTAEDQVFVAAFVLGIVRGGGHTDLSGLIAVLPWLLYFLWLFRDGFGGRSFGKSVMGLQVVDVDTGQGAGFGASFKRNLPMLIPFAPLVAAAQMSRGPRLGDGWANTRVVWKKHQGRGPF